MRTWLPTPVRWLSSAAARSAARRASLAASAASKSLARAAPGSAAASSPAPSSTAARRDVDGAALAAHTGATRVCGGERRQSVARGLSQRGHANAKAPAAGQRPRRVSQADARARRCVSRAVARRAVRGRRGNAPAWCGRCGSAAPTARERLRTWLASVQGRDGRRAVCRRALARGASVAGTVPEATSVRSSTRSKLPQLACGSSPARRLTEAPARCRRALAPSAWAPATLAALPQCALAWRRRARAPPALAWWCAPRRWWASTSAPPTRRCGCGGRLWQRPGKPTEADGRSLPSGCGHGGRQAHHRDQRRGRPHHAVRGGVHQDGRAPGWSGARPEPPASGAEAAAPPARLRRGPGCSAAPAQPRGASAACARRAARQMAPQRRRKATQPPARSRGGATRAAHPLRAGGPGAPALRRAAAPLGVAPRALAHQQAAGSAADALAPATPTDREAPRRGEPGEHLLLRQALHRPPHGGG